MPEELQLTANRPLRGLPSFFQAQHAERRLKRWSSALEVLEPTTLVDPTPAAQPDDPSGSSWGRIGCVRTIESDPVPPRRWGRRKPEQVTRSCTLPFEQSREVRQAIFVACPRPVKTVVVIDIAQAPFLTRVILAYYPRVRVEFCSVERREKGEEIGIALRHQNARLMAPGRSDVIGAENLGKAAGGHWSAGLSLSARSRSALSCPVNGTASAPSSRRRWARSIITSSTVST